MEVFTDDDCFKDTVEWTSLNNGYLTSQLYHYTTVKMLNSDVLHGGFQDNGNFVTFSGNPLSHWSITFNGDEATLMADNEQDFYLTIQRGRPQNEIRYSCFNRLVQQIRSSVKLIPLHTNLLILLLWMRMMIIYVIWQNGNKHGEIIFIFHTI